MRRAITALMLVMACRVASAGGLPPESFGGAIWGAVLGGLAAGDCRDPWSGKGAAIGAGVGFALGAIAGESRREHARFVATAHPGPGYGHGCASVAVERVERGPNRVLGGVLAGAAAGALIGEGAGGKPGRGAVIGAATGLVLGSAAEHHARMVEARAAAFGSSFAARPASPARAPCSVLEIPGAPRHQIPDAPRVPDAPAF